VFGGFLLGPYGALHVSLLLAPGSDLVQTVAVFTFALILIGGTLLWAGLGIAAVVARALMGLLRGRLPSWPAGASERVVPPGYGLYVGFGAGFGVLVGVVTGIATALTLPSAVASGLWQERGTA